MLWPKAKPKFFLGVGRLITGSAAPTVPAVSFRCAQEE